MPVNIYHPAIHNLEEAVVGGTENKVKQADEALNTVLNMGQSLIKDVLTQSKNVSDPVHPNEITAVTTRKVKNLGWNALNGLTNKIEQYKVKEKSLGMQVYPMFTKEEENYTYRVSFQFGNFIESLVLMVIIVVLIYIWCSIGRWMMAYLCQALHRVEPSPEQAPAPDAGSVEAPAEDPYANDLPPAYSTLSVVMLPPSPSAESGAKPQILVQEPQEDPPTFQEAIIKMLFREAGRKLGTIKRSTSCESTLQKDPAEEKESASSSNPASVPKKKGMFYSESFKSLDRDV